ncbi:hypothetical protein IW262DRAFT_1302016 [Armillaria fumosa]|nr:hypothetical protein IW262DRAFT_1302016 [Armillaria fumosa]
MARLDLESPSRRDCSRSLDEPVVVHSQDLEGAHPGPRLFVNPGSLRSSKARVDGELVLGELAKGVSPPLVPLRSLSGSGESGEGELGSEEESIIVDTGAVKSRVPWYLVEASLQFSPGILQEFGSNSMREYFWHPQRSARFQKGQPLDWAFFLFFRGRRRGSEGPGSVTLGVSRRTPVRGWGSAWGTSEHCKGMVAAAVIVPITPAIVKKIMARGFVVGACGVLPVSGIVEG